MDKDLDDRLARMTLLVRNFALGSVPAGDFERQYADFYYYEALDGHEASSALPPDELKRLRYVVELHRRVQIEIVNRLAVDGGFPAEDMRLAGRLTEQQAVEESLRVCADVGVSALLASCNNE